MSIVGLSDPFTRDHQMRVSILSVCIGQRMDLSPSQIEDVKIAGLLHDIGKKDLPAGLLEKVEGLSQYERNIIMDHPQTGFDMLEGTKVSLAVKQSVLQHHERLDGSGYPASLSGDQIRIEAKIVTVADVIDAMAIHRPYNPTQGIDNALQEIAKNKGNHYDPTVVDICLGIFTIAKYLVETDVTTAFLNNQLLCC